MSRIYDNDNLKNRNIVGRKVKKLRTESLMSQQELSDKLEMCSVYICRGSISRIEDQSRTVTDIELAALADVFEVPISELFEDFDLPD